MKITLIKRLFSLNSLPNLVHYATTQVGVLLSCVLAEPKTVLYSSDSCLWSRKVWSFPFWETGKRKKRDYLKYVLLSVFLHSLKSPSEQLLPVQKDVLDLKVQRTNISYSSDLAPFLLCHISQHIYGFMPPIHPTTHQNSRDLMYT